MYVIQVIKKVKVVLRLTLAVATQSLRCLTVVQVDHSYVNLTVSRYNYMYACDTGDRKGDICN